MFGLPLNTLAFHVKVLVQIPATLVLIQLLVNALGKAEEEDSSAWTPALTKDT